MFGNLGKSPCKARQGCQPETEFQKKITLVPPRPHPNPPPQSMLVFMCTNTSMDVFFLKSKKNCTPRKRLYLTCNTFTPAFVGDFVTRRIESNGTHGLRFTEVVSAW